MSRSNYFKVLGTAVILSAVASACVTDRSADDEKITADVQRAIAQHPDLGPPNQIYVDTHDHVVYLSGLVYDGLSDANATAVARQVPGVTRVKSTISLDK